MARHQRSLWPKRNRVIQVLFLSVALMVEIPCVGAAEQWDYIRVGRNAVAEPKWVTRGGKAQVEIRGDHIQIHVDYADSADGLSRAAVAIVGTIGADHTITASCTFLNTDAAPIQLNGHYSIRNDLQIWGEKRKVITHKEIVFSPSANIYFLGFITKEVRDE